MSEKGRHVERELSELLDAFEALPFLFIGSGMSIRYFDLPNWMGLLDHFAQILLPGNPLALQAVAADLQGGARGSSAGIPAEILPDVATRIEQQFNQLWLRHEDYAEARKESEDLIRHGLSPFKLEVARFILERGEKTTEKNLLDELSCLKNVAKRSVAGIITTNYDQLAEDTFSGYSPFIGQEELLFGRTQGIAEIYKIHGCCQHPASIILTRQDYDEFNARDAYLAARLLTIFIDHPIVFLGYSVGDPNIQEILKEIVHCLSQENLNKLQKRLVFIEYVPDADRPEIRDYSLGFEDGSEVLEMTRVRLSDFLPLYKALLNKRYQYNPKLLRQLKRDIYQLVADNKPTDKFQVVDIEDDEQLADVDVVVGVGVGTENGVGGVGGGGHNIPGADELYRDILFDDGNFDVKSLVEGALGKLLKHHSYSLPLHKYVSRYESTFGREAPLDVKTHLKAEYDQFLNSGQLRKRSASPISETSVSQIVARYTDDEALHLVPQLKPEEIDREDLGEFLRTFLQSHPDVLTHPKPGPTTALRRLIKIYDWMCYGKRKEPPEDGSELSGDAPTT